MFLFIESDVEFTALLMLRFTGSRPASLAAAAHSAILPSLRHALPALFLRDRVRRFSTSWMSGILKWRQTPSTNARRCLLSPCGRHHAVPRVDFVAGIKLGDGGQIRQQTRTLGASDREGAQFPGSTRHQSLWRGWLFRPDLNISLMTVQNLCMEHAGA